MKTRLCLLALPVLLLGACNTAPRGDGSSYYYPSNSPGSTTPSIPPSIASMAGSSGSRVPRGGYAPGSGPTAMPQGNQFMYQQKVSGPYGRSSSTGFIQSSGGVQSYQTIGNMPVYPGMVSPSSPPVYVPGFRGAPGYYMNSGGR